MFRRKVRPDKNRGIADRNPLGKADPKQEHRQNGAEKAAEAEKATGKKIGKKKKKGAKKTLTPEQRRRAQKREILSFFQRLIILAVFLFLLFGVFFGITPMHGDDMYPKIGAGDLLLYYRLEKNLASDDIIVFKKDGDQHVGRIVAKGGETVEITNEGELKVNGSIVMETGIFYETYPYEKNTVSYPVTLAADEVFVLCDYRVGGKDSRYFGPVRIGEIKGKVITIVRRSSL